MLHATAERVPPIVLTAVATALGLLPLLFVGDTAGTEILYPLAVVVLGGLVTCTAMTLIVIPGLYLLLTRGSTGDHPAPAEENPEPAPAEVLIPS